MPSASLDFTDGDTFKRFTIANPEVGVATEIVGLTAQRDNTAEEDDDGWTYHPTVVSVTSGSFDVNVAATVLGEPAINDEGPNENVRLTYFLLGRYAN